jgi:uncharacterized membrane protein YhfC
MPINSAAILPSLSMLFVGLAVLLLWKNKFKTKTKIILWGAIAWVASILVKSAVSILLNQSLYNTLMPVEPYGPIIFYIYIGLLTGIFEIFIPMYIILRKRGLLQALGDRNSQLGFGITFGCTEAVILGIVGMLSFAMVASLGVDAPAAVSDLYSKSTSVYLVNSFYSGLERLLAIVIHVFSTMLIFFYIFRKKILYLASAIIYKTFVDGVTAFFLLSPIVFTLEVVEAFFGVIALVSIITLWKLLKQKPSAKKSKRRR